MLTKDAMEVTSTFYLLLNSWRRSSVISLPIRNPIIIRNKIILDSPNNTRSSVSVDVDIIFNGNMLEVEVEEIIP